MEQPKIPTLKDAQKPQVKIKGLAAGLSLIDRLKTFKKKDLAFILAGLGTLFMAPLAEHFMMAPESGDGTMTQGWGGKGGSNLFGSGSSPYESGITGLAPGGAIGGGGDVITPLNVRDPSALVMSPGAQQQPPAGSMAPPVAPPSSSKEPDLKDALANAAARAAGAATRKAALPVPKPGITGSGLRGLGAVSGGSSAGAGLAPISAQNAPNRAAGSNSLSNVRPLSNYKGVARGPGSGSSGDALKRAAGNAADIFNRGGGSAAGNLETAAAQQIPSGSAFGGAGGGGAGGSDKGPGGNNNGGSKSVGESLDFLRQKQEMEKAIDLKWKMKEKRAMFPLELGQEAAKTAVMKGVVEPLAGGFGELLKGTFGPSSTAGWSCQGLASAIPNSQVAVDQTKCAGKTYYLESQPDGSLSMKRCGAGDGQGGIGTPVGSRCRPVASGATGSDTAAGPESGGLTGAQPPVAAETGTGRQNLAQVCGTMTFGSLSGTDLTAARTLKRQSGAVLTGYNSLVGGAAGCDATAVDAGMSVVGRHTVANAKMTAALQKLGQAVAPQGGAAVAAYQIPPEVAEARSALAEAKTKLDAARAALTTAIDGTTPETYFGATRQWAFSEPRNWDAAATAAYRPAVTELDSRTRAHQTLTEAMAGLELAATAQGGTTPKVVSLVRAQAAAQSALDNIESAANRDASFRTLAETKTEANTAVGRPLPQLTTYQSAEFVGQAQTVNGVLVSANGNVATAETALIAARDAHRAWTEAGSPAEGRAAVETAIQQAGTAVQTLTRAVIGSERVAPSEGVAEQPAQPGARGQEGTFRQGIETKLGTLNQQGQAAPAPAAAATAAPLAQPAAAGGDMSAMGHD